jgi:hypothetical protein
MTRFSRIILISFILNADLIWAGQNVSKSSEEDVYRYFAQDSESQGQKAGYRPLGEIRSPLPLECHPETIENQILKTTENAKQFERTTIEFFGRCEKYWTNSEKKGRLSLLEFIKVEYDLSQNSNILQTSLSFRDGTIIDAYVAIKDSRVRRPWVIAKCGVFCNVTESKSVLNYMIHLFDQSPFNVIFLGNRTGVDYIMANQSLTIGGYSETHDYYEAGYWLKNLSPYRDTVGSLHALGMSLAGSAALYIEPLADSYGYDENHRLFQSVMSFCPVVNLQPTIIDMFTNKKKRQIFSKLTWDELQQVRPALHEVDAQLDRKGKPEFEEFPDLMGNIVSYYAAKWGRSGLTFRNIREIASIGEVWDYNQFSALTKPIKTPLWVWASKDDSIVSYDLNAGSLAQSWVYQNSEDLAVVSLNAGNHCAYSTSYGFSLTSSLIRSFVMANSRDFLNQRLYKVKPLVLNGNLIFSKWRSERHLRQWWEASASQSFLTLNIETYNLLERSWCKGESMYDPKTKDCRHLTKVKVPLQIFSDLGFIMPSNNTEAEVLSRKLNSQIRLLSDGKNLEGTTLIPNQIGWFDYGQSSH